MEPDVCSPVSIFKLSLKKRYNVIDTAKALGKTPAKIRELCRSGQLRAKNIRPNSERAEWQIFEDDINAFGESNDILAAPQKLTRRLHPRVTDANGTNPIQAAEDLLAEAVLACKPKGKR
ncbi:hypothetical protein [uncultured Rhodoblastus sp.]|uniref:hypothetical protein n=1 Tax=uncultured Rhodoblastus sp. TaxID=543037 RepID=UPI0025DDE398|nr:hypothetical protein [uncultured Rhodoblastus sp.]